MNLLLAKIENLPAIMLIIKDAQAFLASQNIDQWQDGYPEQEIIRSDIARNESYIVTDESKQIMGSATFTTDGEPTYARIEGAWLTPATQQYGVIHRMAVSSQSRKTGIAKFFFQKFEQKLRETNIAAMRIDTHEDNLAMQGLLKKLGYVYCGIIYLESGSKRLAFEKIM